MEGKIYQIKVELRYSEPIIWRRILVNSNILLVDLHRILQTVMGWTNSHLHLFSDNRNEYSPIEFEVEGAIDSRITKLSKILKKENEKILYEYDFGDGWEHDLILEKIQLEDENSNAPICIDGKRNCPPEDCGGIGGYENLLEIISDKKHPEYKETITWLGGKFDPEYINIEKINKSLKKKDYGCIWLE